MVNTLNGISLGHISSIKPVKQEDVDQMALALDDSDQAILWSMSGAIRVFNINGIFTATTKASLMDDFVLPIDAIVNGDQSGVIFHFDLWAEGTAQTGNFTVMCNNFTWEAVEGIPLQIKYTISILEGTV